MKIRKDDNVIVVSGKSRGKTGKVVLALPKENKVVIAGVNVIKVHKRAQKSGTKGQIIDKSMPIHVSNVMLIDPKNSKPSRIGITRDKDGKKSRVSKKSGTTL
ncbi:MAG: 50S ribosomal protein L24 [Patescibacteria group bacterium]